MTLTFNQQTGIIKCEDGSVFAVAYSGYIDGRNNPAMEKIHDVGPIPKGYWKVGRSQYTEELGLLSFPLTPVEGTQTYGRSEFWIHGDNPSHPGMSSKGCIVTDYVYRHKLDIAWQEHTEGVTIRVISCSIIT